MGSVGFTAQQDHELDKLREAWRSLNDLMRNLLSAESSLRSHDVTNAGHHITVAKWNVDQVKKSIAFVGQAKTEQANK